MKNPLWKSLLYASIPAVIVVVMFIIYTISVALGVKPEEILLYFILSTLPLGLGMIIFCSSFDTYDYEAYQKSKERNKIKRIEFDEKFEKMKQENEKFKQDVDERIKRWDDF